MEPINRLSPAARKALIIARKEANKFKTTGIYEELLFLGILKHNKGAGTEALRNFGITYESAFEILRLKYLEGGKNNLVSNDGQDIFKGANYRAKELGHKSLDVGHLLLTMISERWLDRILDILNSHTYFSVENFRTEILEELEYESSKNLSIDTDLNENLLEGQLEYTLWIDPGNASNSDIVALFESLSSLHGINGGNRLSFVRDEKGKPLSIFAVR